jgi:hypothetical protein
VVALQGDNVTGKRELDAYHAHEYHERGWPVFPLPARQKAPPPSGVTGADGIDLTAEQIDAIDWSACNIGLRMPGDVIGLDLDSYKGGDETLAKLEDDLGPLPATWIIHNGRPDGSGIRLYRVPWGSVFVTGLPAIDIIQRGHRYAMAPGSVHPSGRVYALDDPNGGEAETFPRVDDLPDLPPAWTAHLLRTSLHDGDRTRVATSMEMTEFIDSHTRADDPGYLTVIAGYFTKRTSQGRSRHDEMTHCLNWAMEHVRAEVLAAKSAVDRLAELWQTAVAPDMRRMELFSPRRTTEFEAMVRHAIGKANAKTQAELFELHDNAYSIPVNTAQPPSSRESDADTDSDDDGMVPLVDWTKPHDEVDDIVDRLVRPGRWLQFVASAKQGKSSLTLFMAIELSEGRDPFDGTAQAPVTVLYCDGEMGASDLGELIRDCGHDPARLENLHCTVEPMRLDLAKGPDRLLSRVDDLLARNPTQAMVVVLDGLNGFVNPEASENGDETWKPFYRRAVQPLKRQGIAVVSNDNMGKDKTRGSRGSSVKNDKADAVVEVRRTDQGTRLKATHGRGGAYIDVLDLGSEGFDRAKPIRYWRITTSWPAGTAAAAAVLDSLGIPVAEGRRKVRARLNDEVAKATAAGLDADRFRIANEALGAALRYRKQPAVGP